MAGPSRRFWAPRRPVMQRIARRFVLSLCLIGAVALPASAEYVVPPLGGFEPAALAFHPQSSALLLVRGDTGVRVLDFGDPRNPLVRTAISVRARAAAFMPDGARIVTGDTGGMLRFWSLDGHEAGAPIQASTAQIESLTVSPSGRFIAVADSTLAIRLRQPDGKSLGRLMQMRRQRVESPCTRIHVASAPDEMRIAAISCTNEVAMWSVAGWPIAVPGGRDAYEACCAVRVGFTADGRFLVAVRAYQPGFDGFVWPLARGGVGARRTFPRTDSLRDFAMLPGGHELLVLDKDGIRRTNARGQPRGPTLVPPQPDVYVGAVAASADGTRIATIEEGAIVLRAGDGALLTRPPR